LNSFTAFFNYQLIRYPEQVRYLAESILGLPKPPWAYERIACTEKDIMHDMGLIKVYPSQQEYPSIDEASPYLVFPNKEIALGPGESPERSQNTWRIRQDLAYFLNIHLLSQEYWVDTITADFSTTLAKPWFPGKALPSSPLFTNIDSGSPYILLDTLYILPTDGSPPRQVGRDDQLPSSTSFHWEIYKEGVHGERFLSGRALWMSIFNKHLKKQWQSIGSAIQAHLRLTPIEIWRDSSPDPDVAV
jgi:hypothetical protein